MEFMCARVKALWRITLLLYFWKTLKNKCCFVMADSVTSQTGTPCTRQVSFPRTGASVRARTSNGRAISHRKRTRGREVEGEIRVIFVSLLCWPNQCGNRTGSKRDARRYCARLNARPRARPMNYYVLWVRPAANEPSARVGRSLLYARKSGFVHNTRVWKSSLGVCQRACTIVGRPLAHETDEKNNKNNLALYGLFARM